MSSSVGFKLVRDHNGEWFIIPFHKAKAWAKFINSSAYESGNYPSYATNVDPEILHIYSYDPATAYI